MNSLDFFKKRIMQKIDYKVDLFSVSNGAIKTRAYQFEVKKVKRSLITFDISWIDYDISNKRIGKTINESKNIEIRILETMSSQEVMSSCIEQIENKVSSSDNSSKMISRPKSQEDLLRDRINVLLSGNELGVDEIPPTKESVQKFWEFYKINSNLLSPDIFSSKYGYLRVRWSNGPGRTLWINFPGDNIAGFSITMPRVADYGLCRLNGKCPDIKDIFRIVSLLGVPILK
jgi:hypothetical protein